MNHTIRSSHSATFQGGGAAGDLFRGHDWQQSPLGDPQHWPQSLTTLIRVMLNSGQPMHVAWGPERILLYNDGYATILGARHPQAFGQPFFTVWPEVQDAIGALMNRVFLGEPVNLDNYALTLYRNGYPEEAYFTFSYTPVPDDRVDIAGLFCVCTEMTGRVSSERQEAVNAKRERDRLFEMSRDLFGAANFDGYFSSINPSWSRQLERSMESLLERPFIEIVHPDDVALTREVVATLRSGEPVHQAHIRLLKADGTPISFAWSAVPGEGADSSIFYTVGRDISEDLRREEVLRQGHKMEAVGQLTGGLAHDFNNLLQAAHGSLDLILRMPNDPERVARLARNGMQATERGAKLTAQLLAFSRAQKFELRPIDIVGLVAGMDEILQTSVGPLVRVSIDAGQQDLSVSSDPTQLEMAFLNLAINARDAMPQGGELRVTAREQRVDGDPDLPHGQYVEIRVADTGTGMSAEVAARAFEPFYSTKGTGRGTGLGLSQVYAMAKQAGGTARIAHNKPHGTVVSVWLPSIECVPKVKALQADSSPAANFQAKRVLLVDDDHDVRLFLATTLEALGFNVTAAESAEDGLAVLDSIDPDILLVDFAMPGMNGAQMAEVVRARYPDLPIIFASGYSQTAAIERAVGKSAVVLRKPFGVSDLEAVLNAALRPGDALAS